MGETSSSWQWEKWDATSDYHSSSYHPYCSCCEKYLVIPTKEQYDKYAQTCEHYEAYGMQDGMVLTGDYEREIEAERY